MLRDYFNSKAGTWDKNVAEKDTNKLSKMAEKLELKPGMVVLDVGTGTGVFLPYLLDGIGEKGKIYALDIAEEMLAKAREKNPGRNIEYLHADIADVPLDEDMVDCAVCYSSFPHFPDKKKSLSEIKRVLKTGGRVFICHTSSRAHINGIHSHIDIMKDDLLPDKSGMRRLLSEAGFNSIQVEEDDESYFAAAVKPG
jgi:ubiquinone/menaquinone biosynthesis C-methylase UbiE